MNKILNILDYIFSHKLRKCIYCKKWKLCQYIGWHYNIDNIDKDVIEGWFCNNCQKLPSEKVLKILEIDKRKKEYNIWSKYFKNLI